MIQTVDDYYKHVMQNGAPELQELVQLESLFSQGTAKKMVAIYQEENPGRGLESDQVAMIQREIMALLISHRSLVLVAYMKERGRGVKMATDGPIVVSGN